MDAMGDPIKCLGSFVAFICEFQNALLSSMPHLLMWIVGILVSQISDWCSRNRYASVTAIRKAANTLCE